MVFFNNTVKAAVLFVGIVCVLYGTTPLEPRARAGSGTWRPGAVFGAPMELTGGGGGFGTRARETIQEHAPYGSY